MLFSFMFYAISSYLCFQKQETVALQVFLWYCIGIERIYLYVYLLQSVHGCAVALIG